MSQDEYFLRCRAIIQKLRKSGEATFEEINDYLERESEICGDDLTLSKRSLGRNLEKIRSRQNIDIQFDFSSKVYRIADDGQADIHSRMLESFDMFSFLNVANDLSQYMYFEKRKPQGTEHFYGLLHAIKNRYVIGFTHQKFWEGQSTKRIVEPYSLKESQYRWYLLAKDRKDNKIKTFGLDRITGLDITKQKFEYPKNFNVNEMFRYCFGVIANEDKKPEEIIISFERQQGNYIKSLPIHETQQIIVDNKDELRIKLTLHITNDFIRELLSNGDTFTVISPKSLKRKVCEMYENGLKNNK